jgi:hypothetical protein
MTNKALEQKRDANVPCSVKKIRKKERLKAKNTDSFWGQRDGSKRIEAL